MKVARCTVIVMLALSLAACGTTTTSSVVLGKKIALLMPDSKTTRYENQDRPLFQARVQSVCQGCEVLYSNSNGDSAAQQQQAESALASGANVLVLDPVDGPSGTAIAAKAAARHIPVIAYDRLVRNVTNVSYFVSVDRQAVGALQATTLLASLKGKDQPSIVMLNGDSNDSDASLFKLGAHSALDGKAVISKEYDTPTWSSAEAESEMAGALMAVPKVDGVYAASDDLAQGAISAIKQAGLTPLPPVTGADAALQAVQRIVSGEQYMTVYASVRQEAETAAQLAYDLAYGIAVPAATTGGKAVSNGPADIPAVLVTPVAVTRKTLVSTVLADGFWTRGEICTGQYVSACAAAGIS